MISLSLALAHPEVNVKERGKKGAILKMIHFFCQEKRGCTVPSVELHLKKSVLNHWPLKPDLGLGKFCLQNFKHNSPPVAMSILLAE